MQQSSNNLCTVVLLLALGYLIYYLMKTNKKPKDEKPNNKEKFTDENDNHEQVQSLKYVKNSNLNNNLENSDYLANYQDNNAPVNTNPIELMPVTKTNIKQTVVNSIVDSNVNKVSDFKAFDDDYTPFTNLSGVIDDYGTSVDWSDLNNAFNGPLVDTTNTLDLVKMNQSEMKKYNSDDFLPKEVIKGAFDDYSQAKFAVDNDNLINTDRYVIGINTVGQSLKNGSHDIRGTIPNPKFSVSPWNNSTYEPDYNIKPLC
jgi:hypothetical protein